VDGVVLERSPWAERVLYIHGNMNMMLDESTTPTSSGSSGQDLKQEKLTIRLWVNTDLGQKLEKNHKAQLNNNEKTNYL
jgi:hypothetical protein